jgi:hypothetical protein
MTHMVQILSERVGASALILVCAGALGGCDESGPRVFTAQRYRPDLACLEIYAPLGLVEAEDVGALCEPVCLAQDEELFVSTVCPPYPAAASVEPSDNEACAAALAAPSCDDAETPDAEAPDASAP